MLKIAPSFVERIWGSTQLEPWFPNPPKKIGEVQFHAEPRLPILVKFIFTTEKLSVQVHPKGDSGKTEKKSSDTKPSSDSSSSAKPAATPAKPSGSGSAA